MTQSAMTLNPIREYRPDYSSTQRIRHKWISPSLEMPLHCPADLDDLELKTLVTLDAELCAALTTANIDIRDTKLRCRADGVDRRIEIRRLELRRAFLVGLRYACCHRLASARRDEKAERIKQANSWNEMFVHVCRKTLDREQFLALVELADSHAHQSAFDTTTASKG